MFSVLTTIHQNKHLNNEKLCPGWVAQLDGALSCTPKGCRFDPGQGEYERQLTDVALSYIDVCMYVCTYVHTYLCISFALLTFLSLSNQQ